MEDQTMGWLSILSPRELQESEYRNLSETTFHDLGLDRITQHLTNKIEEQHMIRRVMTRLTADPEVVQYRCDVFADLMRFPEMRNQMMDLLHRVHYLQDYVSLKRDFDKKDGAWDLLHRLAEISDYIECVEAMHLCLSKTAIQSEGLKHLRDAMAALYEDSAFAELKKDIAGLKASTANLKSVTLGINLNERFEADSLGLISINNKPFNQSHILSNFLTKISSRDQVKDGNAWDGGYGYQQVNQQDVNLTAGLEHFTRVAVAAANPLMGVGLGVYKTKETDTSNDIMHYMNRIVDQMLASVVKELKEVLNRYVTISIYPITGLVPEFVYYIRWAEYMERLQELGLPFCKANVSKEDISLRIMRAGGLYNLKLAVAAEQENQRVVMDPKDDSEIQGFRTIVTNDLDFDPEHRVYILTGANRGGKTTITQAIGLLFVLAQGGIYVPAESFTFHPVDQICTHFPADEDKTLDYGRLGEECSRFRELYQDTTEKSLLLLNETFSTTSFEEGYYIARDASRAILKKGVRTIYNTHMHKLAEDLQELRDPSCADQAASLVMKSEKGRRSYKVMVAPPEGSSYAKDIAEKYGVTYEMLTQNS